MSKKKKIIVIVAILLAILISFLGGQTFSKYITEVVGNVNTKIANWNFVVNGQTSETQTINLESTINNRTVKDKKVAPGTKGTILITIDGTGSDVGIKYDVMVDNETTKPNNLRFKYKGQNYNSISDITRIITGVINANDEDKVKTYEIGWEWLYEIGGSVDEIAKHDREDMEALERGAYTFDLTVIGSQIVPKENEAI